MEVGTSVMQIWIFLIIKLVDKNQYVSHRLIGNTIPLHMDHLTNLLF